MRHGLVACALAACACAAGPPSTVSNRGDRHADAAVLAREADRLLDASTPVDYRRPMLDAPVDRTKATQQFVAACRAGDRRSCWIADALQPPDPHDAEEVTRLVRAGCRAHDLMSCRAMFDHGTDTALPGWIGRAGCYVPDACDVRALRRECEAGFPDSCESLAAQQPDDEQALRARTAELQRDGCSAGILSECWHLLDDVAADDATLAYRQRCRLTLRDCVVVATRASDLKSQRDLLEHDCQYGERELSCAYLVHSYADHSYVEPVSGRAQALHAWLCRRKAHPPPECSLPLGAGTP